RAPESTRTSRTCSASFSMAEATALTPTTHWFCLLIYRAATKGRPALSHPVGTHGGPGSRPRRPLGGVVVRVLARDHPRQVRTRLLPGGTCRQRAEVVGERQFPLDPVLDRRRQGGRIIEGAVGQGQALRPLVGQRRAAGGAESAPHHVRRLEMGWRATGPFQPRPAHLDQRREVAAKRLLAHPAVADRSLARRAGQVETHRATLAAAAVPPPLHVRFHRLSSVL